MMIHWRRGGIIVIPYLDYFMFTRGDFGQCVMIARSVENDFVLAGLNITMSKCCPMPSHQRRQLGLDLNFEAGKF